MTGQAGDTEARRALLDAADEWLQMPVAMYGRLDVIDWLRDRAAALPSGTTEPPAPGEEGLRAEVERLCAESEARGSGFVHVTFLRTALARAAEPGGAPGANYPIGHVVLEGDGSTRAAEPEEES